MPIELRIFVAWSIAFGLTYWLTPRMIRLAGALGIIDVPGGRHAHKQPTPLLGGLGVFIGTMVGALLLAPSMGLALTLPLAMAAGLVDDYCKCKSKELSALPKIILQFLPATVLVLMGHTIHHVSNPFGEGMLMLPWWIDYPLTLAWLIGITNAVNFIDGMDGLVTGVTGVASFTLLIIALINGSPETAVWMAATLGGCIAFLRYNFYPAKIFIGDTGTNFLGFLLGAVSVTGYFKAATLAGIAAPMMAFAIPVFNLLFVVVRRMGQGKTLVQALTHGDLEHSFNVLHRRAGFNPMETVLIFLMAAMLLSASALGVMISTR